MATKNQRAAKHARRIHHAQQSRVAQFMEDDLNAMTVPKLRDLAKRSGLVFPAKATKSALVAGILNAKIRKLVSVDA